MMAVARRIATRRLNTRTEGAVKVFRLQPSELKSTRLFKVAPRSFPMIK
jgi:hypothetical protein